MANYYTYFSLILRLPDEAAQAYALEMATQAKRVNQHEETPDKLPESLKETIENFVFETDADNSEGEWCIWLHSEYGGIDAACAYIQHLLRKYDWHGRVAFEWSNDCSKPRVDAYGGGAAIITTRKIIGITTSEWLAKHGLARAGLKLD